jgi:hypothetical protein
MVSNISPIVQESLSRGELDTPAFGNSWKVSGRGEKPTFLAVLEPAGSPNEDTGDDTGGVSVESWRFERSEASSASSWPFSRKSRAFSTCSRSSLLLFFGGVAEFRPLPWADVASCIGRGRHFPCSSDRVRRDPDVASSTRRTRREGRPGCLSVASGSSLPPTPTVPPPAEGCLSPAPRPLLARPPSTRRRSSRRKTVARPRLVHLLPRHHPDLR